MIEEAVNSGYRESNSTADRALTILNMFDDRRLVVSANEVASTLSVARSTAYRYLQSLVTSKFLEEAPGGGFRLGLRLLELAKLARRGYGLSDAALPLMQDLAERFHQTVLLTRRVGSSIVCVEREEADGQYVRLSYERGTTLPINAGASALILLAWSPEDEIRSLLSSQQLHKFTPNTVVDVGQLMERLEAIRAQGYSVTHGEVDPDMMGVAVPVFREDGVVVACLSFVVFENRLQGVTAEKLIAALLVSARQLGAVLELSS
ncbi:IclR family transcriptional regulator [Subtercola endophyticus]|uniref:IclR family transcriptional regulator n=1 Tax=Subtercola endophyticus TaxID=2895559 RepID=UPI001E425FFE|nr:IclR family transcriptional regulator [Subtercola endophyticus]UFS59799.1 IclR family transcriptional regulator [Subtercola endophyticus]